MLRHDNDLIMRQYETGCSDMSDASEARHRKKKILLSSRWISHDPHMTLTPGPGQMHLLQQNYKLNLRWKTCQGPRGSCDLLHWHQPAPRTPTAQGILSYIWIAYEEFVAEIYGGSMGAKWSEGQSDEYEQWNKRMRRDQLSHAWGQGCPNGQCKCVAYCLTCKGNDNDSDWEWMFNIKAIETYWD